MIGRDPKWIAAQIGHVSPAFTFSVCQQVATRRYVDEQAIWALMRFADEPAERAPAVRSRAATAVARTSRRGSSTGRSSGSTRPPQTTTIGGFSPVNSPAARDPTFKAFSLSLPRGSVKKLLIYRTCVMGTAGLEPATSRV
jgi:hypothetical protein